MSAFSFDARHESLILSVWLDLTQPSLRISPFTPNSPSTSYWGTKSWAPEVSGASS